MATSNFKDGRKVKSYLVLKDWELVSLALTSITSWQPADFPKCEELRNNQHAIGDNSMSGTDASAFMNLEAEREVI